MFVVQPLAGIFYPVSVLPAPLQAVSWFLPASHVFEGMRQALRGEAVSTGHLAAALGLDLVSLGAGALFFAWMLSRVREKGYLGRLGMD